ncbi:MAG: hypothetical protein HY541_00810 [Deltaproteobacteria bacterium]|nr:hypothetical protein [Deltaproteobacteria bacterium]
MGDSTYSIGGYSIEEFVGLTPEEQDAILAQEWADLSAEELEEAKTEFDENISTYKDDLEDSADELEDIDDDPDAEELLAEVEAEIESAEETEDNVSEEAADIQEHTRTYTTDEAAYINGDDLEMDGGTYSYEMSGGDVYVEGDAQWALVSADTTSGTYTFKVSTDEGYCYVEVHTNNGVNPFGEQTDEEYLQEEGVTNESGEVVEDYNADGFMNQDDIDAALEARDGSTLEDSKTQFYYSGGISSGYLETLKTTWPTDLLKISYWGDSTTSFYDELFGDETTSDSHVDVIEGYNDSVEGLTSTTVSQYTDGTLDSTLQAAAEEALEALYGYIDDPSGDSVAEIWSDIWASWTEAGLTDAQKATLIQYLTLTVALNDKTNFGALFGPAIITLETMLDYRSDAHENYTDADKLIVLLLEGQTGAVGNYGGSSAVWTTAFSADGATQGSWKDQDENVTAINNYKAIVAAMGGSLTGAETTALANEKAILETEEEAASEGGNVELSDDDYEKLLDNCNKYGDNYDTGADDGMTKSNRKAELTALVNKINDWIASGVSAEELGDKIVNYIYGLNSDWQDDIAATIVVMLKELAPDLFKEIQTKSFSDDMMEIIWNGWFTPGAVLEASDALGYEDATTLGWGDYTGN